MAPHTRFPTVPGATRKPASSLAKEDTKGAQQPTNLVLNLYPNAHQNLTSAEQRSDLIAIPALDLHLLEPAGPDDLSQPGRVVPVGLVGAHLERRMRVARVKAYDRQIMFAQFIPEPDG